jgi:hypothetical protein
LKIPLEEFQYWQARKKDFLHGQKYLAFAREQTKANVVGEHYPNSSRSFVL